MKLVCNNCDTAQSAEVFECCIPFDKLGRSDVCTFFILRIEKCSKCGEKKIQPVYLAHSGQYVREDFLKQKFFERAERGIVRKLEALPRVEKSSEQGRFYLRYIEYGIIKKCFSNLSTLKLGLFENKDLDLEYAKHQSRL